MRKGQTRQILSPEEISYRRKSVCRMAGTGMVDREIAEVLGVSWRTVLRDRQAEGIPPGYDPKTRFKPRREWGAEFVGGVAW
jgi:transposase